MTTDKMSKNSAFDIDAARRRLRVTHRLDHSRYRQRHGQASHDASSIVKRIIEIAAPTRIYQWGSLLRPESFREYSDIDIALEGVLDAETFFRILAEAERLTKFPLDIVQLEKIEPEFADDIRQRGTLVYERK